ncbi:MAG: hypothetical protein AAGD01_09405 [Acidobacteriota bacterium]
MPHPQPHPQPMFFRLPLALRWLRRSRNLSREQLAAALGSRASAIAELEDHLSALTLHRLVQHLQAMNFDVFDLCAALAMLDAQSAAASEAGATVSQDEAFQRQALSESALRRHKERFESRSYTLARHGLTQLAHGFFGDAGSPIETDKAPPQGAEDGDTGDPLQAPLQAMAGEAFDPDGEPSMRPRSLAATATPLAGQSQGTRPKPSVPPPSAGPPLTVLESFEQDPSPCRWLVILPAQLIGLKWRIACENVLRNLYEKQDPVVRLYLLWEHVEELSIRDSEPPLDPERCVQAETNLSVNILIFKLTSGLLTGELPVSLARLLSLGNPGEGS